VHLVDSDHPAARKSRGAFFTPPAIADYLASWAVDEDPDARILDPTCGESVFLCAAARELEAVGAAKRQIGDQVFGVDTERESILRSEQALAADGYSASLQVNDFFEIPSLSQIGCTLPEMDAIIGNPPYIRYQEHAGIARKRSRAAALAQGVRLSGLASSWAALLVHACSFLKKDGRLAMVLPAELLTVGYAEPVRRWLRQRFAAVHLVMFERLQFEEVSERVVLVIARGSGGCNAFSLLPLEDASDLRSLKLFGPSHFTVAPAEAGKWSDLLLSTEQRQVFKRVVDDCCTGLGDYGSVELGSVTGANSFFALSEETRRAYCLTEDQLVRISPPGTKHLKGLSLSNRAWKALRDDGEAVWLLRPRVNDRTSSLRKYLARGEADGVPDAYKCRIRDPWWRPPVVPAPDLLFTYMSHRYPRLIRNTAGVSFLNSMHGLYLHDEVPSEAAAALPLLCLNSVTMLGAEIFGRSYGGGVLKMEPKEAAELPVPSSGWLKEAHAALRKDRAHLEGQLKRGLWTNVVKRVDEVLLRGVFGLSPAEALSLHSAAVALRARRMGRGKDREGGSRDVS
jgi:adenine-specific DNA-methyltransferase